MRSLLALLLSLSFLSLSCNRWTAVPVTSLQTTPQNQALAKHFRFLMKDGSVIEVEINRIEYPYVEGTRFSSNRSGLVPTNEKVLIDLREVTRVEVRQFDGKKAVVVATALAVDIPAATLAAVLFVVLATSCPFVYVETNDGLTLIGEAYPGAGLRTLQRNDLMPLPSLPAKDELQMRLTNEAYETQYTDQLELLLVEHDPSLRAVATFDAKAILVSQASAPQKVTDLNGQDQTQLTLTEDAQAWDGRLFTSNPPKDIPLKEGLEATFATLPQDATPVLELTAGNTPWLDVVFGRYFALAGNQFEKLLEKTDDPSYKAEVMQWREREGIDLTVEVYRGGAWLKAAVVPTLGPLALRHIAVPLPKASGVEPLRVRVTGGLGFWRIDSLSLSMLVDDKPIEQRLAPTVAMMSQSDQRASLEKIDQRYQVLEDYGAVMELSFSLPKEEAGKVRDAFLFTNGYYLVHQPVQSKLSIDTLKTIREEPGSFSRFSLDLYRGYENVTKEK